MTIWLWIALISNTVYWVVFFYLLSRRRWNRAALAVGVVHMLFAALVSVAPIRSLIDPDYMGLGLGLLRFEGRAASLPATAFLAWSLSAAWIAVAKGRGRWLTLIAVGDTLFALNLGGGFLLDLLSGQLASSKIQFGEHYTLTGPVAALIPLALFTIPFVASAVWAASRVRPGGTTPPLADGAQEKRSGSRKDTKGSNGFRYSQSRA